MEIESNGTTKNVKIVARVNVLGPRVVLIQGDKEIEMTVDQAQRFSKFLSAWVG